MMQVEKISWILGMNNFSFLTKLIKADTYTSSETVTIITAQRNSNMQRAK